MDLELKDKIAFIAGSTKGIGFTIAQAFLSEGAKVVITGRRSDSLEKAAELLKEKTQKGRILPIQGDMTEPENIRSAVKKTLSFFGGIDTTVANVGSGTASGDWNASLDEWQAGLKTNLLGAVALANETIPHLIRRGGSFTFISSIAGCEATRAPISYSAAKAALQSAVKNLSRQLGASGVRINCVAPGNVLFPGGSWERLLAERREYFEGYIKSEVPMQRFGRPEEIADAVVFLASNRASFITGACLVVDGGQTRSL